MRVAVQLSRQDIYAYIYCRIIIIIIIIIQTIVITRSIIIGTVTRVAVQLSRQDIYIYIYIYIYIKLSNYNNYNSKYSNQVTRIITIGTRLIFSCLIPCQAWKTSSDWRRWWSSSFCWSCSPRPSGRCSWCWSAARPASRGPRTILRRWCTSPSPLVWLSPAWLT